MPDCLVLVERGGDASLDIVSNDYTEATKSAFRRLIASNADDINLYTQNGALNERASIFSATDMELSLTSVVLATSLDRSGIDFVVYDDEDIIDKYKEKLEREIDSGIKFVCISTTFFWDMKHLKKVIDFFHHRDRNIKVILGGQGLMVWGDSAFEKLNDVFCFCYGDIDYFGDYIEDLLSSKIPDDFELKKTKKGESFYVLTKEIPDLDSLFLPDWGLLNRYDSMTTIIRLTLFLKEYRLKSGEVVFLDAPFVHITLLIPIDKKVRKELLKNLRISRVWDITKLILPELNF